MSRKVKSFDKYKFNRFDEIGSPDAETDRFLDKGFIEKDSLNALLDMNNQRSILIGRTGSGKSAILRQIEKSQDKVCRIEPEAMSLRFLSNSTMLQYFRAVDVNLSFFYKILWKHVFIIELLRLHFSYDNRKKENWYTSIKDKLLNKKNNPKRVKALEYFDKWNSEFWLDAEKRVREIENTLSKKFEAEVGADLKYLNSRLKSGEEDQTITKSEIKTKAEHVISETLANDIHEIIKILQEEIFIDTQQKHFIIIDDLDKEWIPSSLRYELIGAMIEVIKEFSVFKGVKIIISLRDNLYQLVFSGNNHQGGQREKFKPLYVDLIWDKVELKELLNKRLFLLSDKELDVKNVFEKAYSKGITGFDYMVERTFYRPRDVISYVNHAIQNANNKTHITLDILRKAEIDYSRERLQAVEDEWGENFGDIKQLFSFLYGKYNGFRVKNIREDDFTSLLLEEKVSRVFRGDLAEVILKWQNQQMGFAHVLKEILFLLFTFGIIGIKKDAGKPTLFFFDRNNDLSVNDIEPNSKIYIHKAFYSVLKINTKELEQDSYIVATKHSQM